MRRKRLRYWEEVEPAEGLDAGAGFEPEAGWPELREVGREFAKAEDLGLWRLAGASDRLTRWRPVLVKGHPRTQPSSRGWPSPDWPDAA
jgi:hypothetical protein